LQRPKLLCRMAARQRLFEPIAGRA
jgi:hypothetical protein